MSLLAQSNRPALPNLSRPRARGLSGMSQRVVGIALLCLHRRRTRAQLWHVPPHILKDMGLNTEDARLEAAKPFWRP